MLHPSKHLLGGTSLDLFQYFRVFHVQGTQNHTQQSTHSLVSAEQSEIIISFDLITVFLTIQPSMWGHTSSQWGKPLAQVQLVHQEKNCSVFSAQSASECSWRQHFDLEEPLAYLRMTGVRLSDQLHFKTTRANKSLQVWTEKCLRWSTFSVNWWIFLHFANMNSSHSWS